jgi:hypothetical protein
MNVHPQKLEMLQVSFIVFSVTCSDLFQSTCTFIRLMKKSGRCICIDIAKQPQ